MKVELEDLAFQYLEPDGVHEHLIARLAETAGAREAYIDEVVERARRRCWPRRRSRRRSTGRAKHLWSIYQKMKKTGRDLEQIYDVVAFRVITESVRDCYDVARRRALELDAGARALQGLHRAAQAEPLPVAAHHGDRPARRAHGGADPHRRRCTASPSRASPRTGSTRRARPALGAGTDEQGVRLAAPAHGVAARSQGPDRVHRDGEDRPLPGRGLRLHAQGRRQGAAQGRDADRPRLRHPLAGRRALLGRAGERPHRAAALRAPQRRHRRDPHLAQPEAVQGLAEVRRHLPRQDQDPPLHPDGAARAQPRSWGASCSSASCASTACSLRQGAEGGRARQGGRSAAARHGRGAAGRASATARSAPADVADAVWSPEAQRRKAAPSRQPSPNSGRAAASARSRERSIGGHQGRRARPTSWSRSPSAARRCPGDSDRRLHQPRPRRHHPHPRLPEGARPRSRAARRRRVGRRVQDAAAGGGPGHLRRQPGPAGRRSRKSFTEHGVNISQAKCRSTDDRGGQHVPVHGPDLDQLKTVMRALQKVSGVYQVSRM